MNPTWLFVAAIYAAAVWLARRTGTPLGWRNAIFFYLLVLTFLWRPMTQDAVNVPVDFLSHLPPWSHVQNIHPANGEINDVALQMVPWAHLVREQWKSGNLPVWNITADSGYPLFGNGQSAAFSFLRLIALPLSLGQSFTAEAAMKFLIALTFTFLFCRRRGYSELASSVGAIAFAFSTFLIVWLHFGHATVAAMIPAILYQIELLSERVTYGRCVFAALLWAQMLYGGHPETASHVFFLAALMVLWIILVERRFERRDLLRFLGALAAAMCVAAMLAAPFLAVFAETVKKTQRYQQLQVHPPEVGFTNFQSSVLLFQPHFYGAVPVDQTWGPAVAESICGFAGLLGIAGWMAMLIEACLTRRFRSREFFFVVVTPVFLMIILDWGPVAAGFHLLFSLAANARIRLLLCFAIAMQSASIIDLIERGRTRAPLIGLAITACGLGGLAFAIHYPNAWIHDNAILSMLPGVAVLALATLAAAANRTRHIAMMLLAVAVVAELWTVGINWNPVVPTTLMYPDTPLITELRSLRAGDGGEPFRIAGVGAMLFPNVSAMYGFEDIRAHDPMSNGRYMGLLRVLTGYGTEAYFAQWKNTDTTLLDVLNVKYLVMDTHQKLADTGRYQLRYDGKDGRIYENRDVLPRFFQLPIIQLEFVNEKYVSDLRQGHDWAHTAILHSLWVNGDQMRSDLISPRPPGAPEARVSVRRTGDTAYELHTVAPRWTFVGSSIPWWPGWSVSMNGRQLHTEQVDGAFLGFVVPPGTSDVRVVYRPLAFYGGLTVALLTLVAMILGAFVLRAIESRRLRSEAASR